MTVRRIAATLPAAAILAAGVSACVSPPPATASAAVTRAVDIAYLRAHPVPPLRGMTTGIVLAVHELGDQCKAKVRTDAELAPAYGGDSCIAWTLTMITANGRTAVAACGGIGRPCPADQIIVPGDVGDYLYFPSDGQIRFDGDIQVIYFGAVSGP